jgi:hypothetical protein
MPVDSKLWDEAFHNSPWSTAFSSPLWHRVTEELGEDASFEWKGILTPLREIRLAGGLLKGYESTVPGVPCGPLAPKIPDSDLIERYWAELNRRTQGRFIVHLRPDSPFSASPFKKIEVKTQLLPVIEKEKRLSEHHKRQLRKARQAGIIVTKARRREDFEACREMYEMSLKRWQRRPAWVYSRKFFDNIHDFIIPADEGSFFISWLSGIPQASALVLFERKRAVYWLGSSINEPAHGAGHMLHWKIMEELEGRGIETYDFGPSAGLEGVERFKEGFGTDVEIHSTIVGPARLFGSYFSKGAAR